MNYFNSRSHTSHQNSSYQNEGIRNYLRQAHLFPSLSKEEEYQLITVWQQKQDQKALDKIINSHMKLVYKIAQGYRGYGLPIQDLISEGHIGMLQALKKFDMSKSFRFSTYATWWIKALIQEYIINSWSLVKIGTSNNQRKLFYKLKKIKTSMGIIGGNSLTPQEAKQIAKELNVPEKDVIDMNNRLEGPDLSLHAPVSQGEGALEWQEWLVDESQNQEQELIHHQEIKHRQAALEAALNILNEREKFIIQHRKLIEEPWTLEKLSEKFSITKERVRQIEMSAFDKMQKIIKRKYMLSVAVFFALVLCCFSYI